MSARGTIKKLILICFSFFFCSGILRAESRIHSDGNLCFTVPAEFAPLSKEIKMKLYRDRRFPPYLIGTKSGSVSITYSIIQLDDDKYGLKEWREIFIKDTRDKYPEVIILKNAIENINEYKWFYLDIVVGPRGKKGRAVKLVTTYGKKILMLKITIQKKKYYQMHEGPNKSLIKSLRVKKVAEVSGKKKGKSLEGVKP